VNDITWILLGIIAAVSVVITYFVIPYLKSKKTTEEWAQIVEKAKTVTKWITTAISAAEIFFKGVGLGLEKNTWVLAFVRTLCEKFGITFDEDVVAAEIEEVGQDLGLWTASKTEDEVKNEVESE
jgi:endonuclease III